MLAAEEKELITAAVDGELTVAEARAFRQLLAASPEARLLYAQLQTDSDRVRALPVVVPPITLRAKIMARVAALTSPPTTMPAEPARPVPRFRQLRAWAPVGIAASLLLCVTAGSFAFFSGQDDSQRETAKHPWSDALPSPHETPTAVPSPVGSEPRQQPHRDPVAVVHHDVSPVPSIPAPKVVLPESLAVAPEPHLVAPNLLAHQVWPKLPPFDFVQVRIPFLRTVAEFEREDVRQELTDELSHDPAFRLDLFVRDTARGVEVFQNAAKASGLRLFADAATLDKLKKKQVHAVVIYLECLNPAELTALFEKIAAADMKFSPRVCDTLHAMPVVRADELELKGLLGTDAGLFKRSHGPSNTKPKPAGQGSKFLDKDGNPKPVSAGTIDSVEKSLTKPPAKSAPKTAVLLTWQTPRTMPAMSKELQQFLKSRGDRKPNAVPAIIVIRPVG